MLEKKQKRQKRHKRIRAKISGTKEIPRLCVFRSAKHIYAQLIDDEKKEVIESANDSEAKSKKLETDKKELKGKTKTAYQVGKLIAEKSLKKKIAKAVFDRGGYIFHGRVKALAEGAREGGLKF